ncbi:MAG TPA: hypothetical protein VFO69_02980 [Allosphingosinicella sp.]|nr:hypothetical protein [Allosphingosinicella sp.]
MRLSIVLAASAVVFSSAAWAQDNAAANEDDKVVCRRSADDDTGTRLGHGRRICRTRAEWRAEERATDGQRQRLERRQNSTGSQR